jgi:hypothetical protein
VCLFCGQGRLWDRSAPLVRAKCRPHRRKGGVGVCVHSTRPGTHAASPGDRSTRPSICVRSSSRKRAQSARRSSDTNSPGGSDFGAGGRSGCCLGSRKHSPHLWWKLWITRVCERRRRALTALKRRRGGATLLGRARPRQPPNVRADQTSGGAWSNSAFTMIR